MIRLFPAGQPESNGETDASELDGSDDTVDPRRAVAAELRPAPHGRPWVYTNMIASADGGTAVDGLSGALGGPGDKAMFGALRAVADAIVAGASTVREEQYRAPRLRAESVAMRRERGQADNPALAIVSRSLNIDLELPLFDSPDIENSNDGAVQRPIIITCESSPIDKRRALESVADIVIAGDDTVSLPRALEHLHEREFKTVLSEGGPSLNGQLISDGLVDEWNLSISPSLLAGDSRRAAIGPTASGPPHGMKLDRVWTDNEILFCRWVRPEPAT